MPDLTPTGTLHRLLRGALVFGLDQIHRVYEKYGLSSILDVFPLFCILFLTASTLQFSVHRSCSLLGYSR